MAIKFKAPISFNVLSNLKSTISKEQTNPSNKSPIQGIAETLNLEFRTPHTLKDNIDEYEYLKKINADLAIVVAYGQIIPKKFLNLAKKGFINIHASLLPKWRGAAPIQMET